MATAAIIGLLADLMSAYQAKAAEYGDDGAGLPSRLTGMAGDGTGLITEFYAAIVGMRDRLNLTEHEDYPQPPSVTPGYKTRPNMIAMTEWVANLFGPHCPQYRNQRYFTTWQYITFDIDVRYLTRMLWRNRFFSPVNIDQAFVYSDEWVHVQFIWSWSDGGGFAPPPTGTPIWMEALLWNQFTPEFCDIVFTSPFRGLWGQATGGTEDPCGSFGECRGGLCGETIERQGNFSQVYSIPDCAFSTIEEARFLRLSMDSFTTADELTLTFDSTGPGSLGPLTFPGTGGNVGPRSTNLEMPQGDQGFYAITVSVVAGNWHSDWKLRICCG